MRILPTAARLMGPVGAARRGASKRRLGMTLCSDNGIKSTLRKRTSMSAASKLGPLEKLFDSFIYWVRMGNRAHMAKILKLHKLDSGQRGR